MRFVIAAFWLLQFLTSFGQNAEDSTHALKKNKLKYISPGFNYHLQISHIDVAPIISMRISSKVYAGGGINYLYYYRNSERVNKNSFGVNLFSRVFASKSLFAHVEYLYSNIPYRNKLIYEFDRVYVANVFIGGGYMQPISDSIRGYFTVLVDLTHSENSPYENKILFKAGLTF
jgi:hypothetical protein